MIAIGLNIWCAATRRVGVIFAMAGDDDSVLLGDDGAPLEVFS